MTQAFFDIEQTDTCTVIRCHWCKRSLIAFSGTADMSFELAVCECERSMRHTAKLGQMRPATFDLSRDD